MAYMTVFEWQRDESGQEYYVAEHPELAGCIASGDTIEEARLNLKAATEDYLEHLSEYGLPIPEPNNLFAQPANEVSADCKKLKCNLIEREVAMA